MAMAEIYVYWISGNPLSISLFAIFGLLALIIYFSFRSGIPGGFATVTLTIIYYFYIIQSRNYTGDQLTNGIRTTLVLGLLYYFIAWIIGGLRQIIDNLIEREANEKRRLQAIVEQLPVGVIITDSEGLVTQTNSQLRNILGFDLPLGYRIEKEEPLHEPHSSPLFQALSTGKPVVSKEFTINRPDGKKITVLISSSPIQSLSGKTIAAASIISDVTAQREIEDRKNDFINMASHELKTPLTSLRLYIDSLSSRVKDFKDARAEKTLSSIKFQTERLQDLATGLLDVSRIQTGKLSLNKESFRLDELVKEIISDLQGSTRNQKLILSRSVGASVIADKFRISQVLTNLITNAAKYSPPGENITIEITKTGRYAQVSVSDKGIGINKSQHKKIFDRLYQVTDAKEKTFPGLGMGLYISKEIVKRHGGTIWVDSEKNQGSIFYFTLPLTK